MRRILVINSHYLPGYKAGGAIQTIANLVEWLGDEFEFYILTTDRDLGDRQPYPDIENGTWQSVGKASVLYLSPGEIVPWSLQAVLRTVDYELLHLNSFFAPLTRHILLLGRIGRLPARPIILAPHGEFSPGAFAFKNFKKRPYVWLTKRTGLYDNIVWRASSDYEKQDILAILGDQISGKPTLIKVAPNLPPKLSYPVRHNQRASKHVNSARVVFLSRIARNKNLDFAVNLLADVDGDVEFDIYGPLEDQGYWQECETLMHRLPANIRATYKGAVPNDQVIESFSRYHLFLFPTRGENFGYVIPEALYAGCPVLTSDQTPWRHLTERRAGWDIPLPWRFQAALRELLSMDHDTFEEWSLSAYELGKQFVQDPTLIEANRQLFLYALTTISE